MQLIPFAPSISCQGVVETANHIKSRPNADVRSDKIEDLNFEQWCVRLSSVVQPDHSRSLDHQKYYFRRSHTVELAWNRIG